MRLVEFGTDSNIMIFINLTELNEYFPRGLSFMELNGLRPIDAALRCTRANMEPIYETCRSKYVRWKPRLKYSELTEYNSTTLYFGRRFA